LEQQAIVRIEQASIEAQTQIAITGLTSEAAHAFVEQLAGIESLMPALSYRDIAGESEPLIVEQLLTPNILGVSRSEGTRFCLSRPEGSRAPGAGQRRSTRLAPAHAPGRPDTTADILDVDAKPKVVPDEQRKPRRQLSAVVPHRLGRAADRRRHPANARVATIAVRAFDGA